MQISRLAYGSLEMTPHHLFTEQESIRKSQKIFDERVLQVHNLQENA
jgi:hypothetical protein